jgi:signal transduction histidine kinase
MSGVTQAKRSIPRISRRAPRPSSAWRTLEQRNRQLELLHLAGQAIGSSLDLDQVLTAVLEAARRLLGVAAVSVWLVDAETGELVCQQATGPQSEAVTGWKLARGEGLAGHVVSSGESLIVADSHADPRHFRGVDERTGIALRSILGVPLRAKSGVLGVLQVADTSLGRFDAGDLIVLEPLAASAAVAIENAQLYARAQHELAERMRAEAALQQHTERLRALHRMDQAILAARSPADIAAAALSHLEHIVPYRWAGAVALEMEGRSASVLATRVREPHQGGSTDGVPLRLIRDVRELCEEGIRVVENGPHSHVEAPMVAHGQPIGIIVIGLESGVGFTEAHQDAIREVANSLAIVIQNARLYDQVRAANERLQLLSHRLVEAQENERRYIACELHDEIGQALTSVIINLQALQNTADLGASKTVLDEALNTARGTLEQVRDMSLNLRPSLLDDLGLIPALRWYCDRYARRTGLAVRFLADPIAERLPMAIEITCFRIVQEALTNVSRHAHARAVTVELRRTDSKLDLLVRDDGKGFDVTGTLEQATQGASVGLLGMSERALFAGGHLQVNSVPGKGTEVHASFPVPGASAIP